MGKLEVGLTSEGKILWIRSGITSVIAYNHRHESVIIDKREKNYLDFSKLRGHYKYPFEGRLSKSPATS